jgi:hypothetical protein
VSDVVVTVPKGLWQDWIDEGDLPGDAPSDYEYHFWIPLVRISPPDIRPGERVYVVAHDRLRGYAPLIRTEMSCRLRPSRSCFVRRGAAVSVTLDEPIRGFQGWRYRWWDSADEHNFPEWRQP